MRFYRKFGFWLRFALFVLLLVFLWNPEHFAPLFKPLTENNSPPIYQQSSLLSLTLWHIGAVFVAAMASTLVAIGMAIFVTRPSGREFLPLSRILVNVGQTFPPVAVLALVVPLVGFGQMPTIIALFLYGLLPIFENTLTGLSNVPETVQEAARGVGMKPWQQLFQVELPLALPLILAGMRLSLVVNLSTATIGSTVAARSLGEVIIAGITTNNLAFILQGGLVVALLAIFLSDGLMALEAFAARRMGQAEEKGSL